MVVVVEQALMVMDLAGTGAAAWSFGCPLRSPDTLSIGRGALGRFGW